MAGTPNFYARGTISPAVFVISDGSSTIGFGVLQADSSHMIVGVAQEGAHDTPGLTGASTKAANASSTSPVPLRVFGDGEECLIVLTGTTSSSYIAGDLLIADNTNGTGTKFSSTTPAGTQYIGGQLLENGLGGDKRRILVRPQIYYHT